MSEWQIGKLADVAEIVMGQSPSGDTCNNYGEGLPLLNGPTEFGVKTPAAIQYTVDPKKISRPDDILFCVRGSTTGRMNWSDKSYAIGRGLAAIRHRSGPDYRYFVKGVIDYNLDSLLASATGSTFPNVSRDQLNDLEIVLPSLPKQRAIASVLSSLDDKIDLLHRQNKTLEAMAETLFRQWFVIQENQDWEVSTLEDHTVVYRGLSYKGSGLADKGMGLPMHNLNSVYEFGGYKIEGIKYYNGEYRERHIVHPGDIIVTNTEQGHEHRLIGFPGIVPKTFGDVGIFSQHIYRFVPNDKTYLTNQFLYYLLMTPMMREQVVAATNGSTVNMLAIDGLQRPEFKLPPKSLITEFSDTVSVQWAKKEKNDVQINILTTLRDTLLPKLMSGEVRVV